MSYYQRPHWIDRFLSNLRSRRCRSLLCVQGGGAKGVWEAGVIAALLDEELTREIVAGWGTSAGAINMFWAATTRPEEAVSEMQTLWLRFAWIIRFSALLAIIPVACVACVLILVPLWLLISLAGLVVGACVVWYICNGRLPGILPVRLVAQFLPEGKTALRFPIRTCTANIDLDVLPARWDYHSVGAFELLANATGASQLTRGLKAVIPPKEAIVASAALPGLFQPFEFKGRKFLDGGLIANLPGEHIRDQGLLGASCMICIVPRRLSTLDSRDHIDHRVLQFLHGLRDRQQANRAEVQAAWNSGDTAVYEPFTHYPILIIEPDSNSRAGLLAGFFLPWLLRSEFQKGFRQGRQFVDAIRAFSAGDVHALDHYLLDYSRVADPADEAPRNLWLKLFANRKW